MPTKHLSQRLQALPVIGRTRRIRRRTEDNRLGFGRKRRPKRLRLQTKPIRGIGVHKLGHGTDDQHLLGVAHPIRRRNNHLIARIEQSEREVEERVLGTHRDDDFVRLKRNAPSS